MGKLDKATEEWIAKQDLAVHEGWQIVERSSDEALEYTADAMDNFGDRAWRKMSVDTQAVEIGIGRALSELIVPVIYKDMEKTMHKKLKVDKKVTEALRHIYIGRLIKNVRKELNERDK